MPDKTNRNMFSGDTFLFMINAAFIITAQCLYTDIF